MSSIFFKGKTYIIKLKKPHTKSAGPCTVSYRQYD